MDDQKSFKQLSSVRLQKAINKNQNIDTKLKKELQILEVKKKASEKAFEQKRSQFLKSRLYLEPLRKSKSFQFNRPKKQSRGQMTIAGLLDLRTSYSTGNLLESLQWPKKDRLFRENGSSSEKSERVLEKLGLDSIKASPGTQKDIKSWCTTFNKLHEPFLAKGTSSNEEIIQGDEGIHFSVNKTDKNSRKVKNLKIPYQLVNRTSSSDGSLTRRLTKQDALTFQRKERSKCWDARERSTILPVATEQLPSKSEGCSSRKDDSAGKGRKHLSLPPLKRTRSKSLEAVRVSLDNYNETKSVRECGNAGSNAPRKTLSWGTMKVRQPVEGLNSWLPGAVDGLKVTEARRGGEEGGEMNLKPAEIERSTSTPDLLDIGPEVEYLLLKDDKTRLRRMRASVHAIGLMGDIKGYRYIRNVEFTPQNTRETNPQNGKVSGNDKPAHAQTATQDSESFRNTNFETNEDDSAGDNCESLMNSSPEPTNIEGSGCDSEEELCDATKGDDELLTDEQDSLSRSTASSLADMFDELKHTRYLRFRPRMTSGDVDDDDDDDDDNTGCNVSYGYRVPMIIVGHTKAVFSPEN